MNQQNSRTTDPIAVLSSGGSPLKSSIRALMERRFGCSFEHVRVHTDVAAANSALALGTQAFAVGSHIVFGEGFYQPESRCGQRLLAHELAHLIQQQNGLASADGDEDRLEQIADEAAGLVADGHELPLGFAFGTAPAGVIQRHAGEECPGTSYDASEPSIWMAANEAIEIAYKNDPKNQNHTIFFGSDFENSLLKIGPETPRPVPNRRPLRPGVAEVILPKGVKNQKFGNILLRELRGLERQRRPDIIDFTNRCFYEIKSTGYADRGTIQLRSYYKITEAILMHHGQDEPPWRLETAPPWYPQHVLSMLSPNPQSLSLSVCTQATDHTRYPGMIIYEVRRGPRRRRRQRPIEIRVQDFWTEYDVIRPLVRSNLPKAIPYFDPDSPDYVIIVPHEFFSMDFVRQIFKEAMKRRWEPFKVQSEFSRNRIRPASIPGLTPENVLMFSLVMAVAGTIVLTTFMGGAVILEGLAAGATALTSVEAGAAATTATTTGTELTIVVIEGSAVPIAAGAGGATAAEAATLASYQAMLASPVAQQIAASAGVALVIGTARSAQADTSSGPVKAVVEQVVPIRAVPIDDFHSVAGLPHASSTGQPSGNISAPDKAKFAVGSKVFFDNKQHWVFGRLTVK